MKQTVIKFQTSYVRNADLLCTYYGLYLYLDLLRAFDFIIKSRGLHIKRETPRNYFLW